MMGNPTYVHKIKTCLDDDIRPSLCLHKHFITELTQARPRSKPPSEDGLDFTQVELMKPWNNGSSKEIGILTADN